MTTRNEIAVVRTELSQMDGEFAAALPAHIPVERFRRVAMTAIQNNPDLVMKCDRRSMFRAFMQAAQDGLLPDGREGAVVPYNGEAQWLPMIGGIRKKARNSGEIATWEVHAAYEHDAFDFELGDSPYVRHKPAAGERGELTWVYSVVTLKTGHKTIDIMSRHDVEKIRAKSRSRKGPWSDPTFYPEMAKKTVARRHAKTLPMSTDLDDLIRRDDTLYDLEGASDRGARAARPSAAGRLAAAVGITSRAPAGDIAAPAQGANAPQQGQIDSEDSGAPAAPKKAASDPHSAPQGQSSGRDEGEAAPAAHDAPAGPTQSDLDEAYARGRAARAKGMPSRACPADYRENDELYDAWGQGWRDAGEADGDA